MEKRKLDSRVRFQHANFTRKLDQARSYKRNAKPKREDISQVKFLSQLLSAAFVIVIAYLLYVPNPLFIKKIQIEGLDSKHQALAQEAVKNFLENKPWYFPSNNYLFVSSSDISKVIAERVPAVSKIVSSKKSFRNKTITINLIEKYERYLVVRPENQLVLYNDGTLEGQMPALKTELPPSGAIVTVKVNHTNPVNDGQQYFSPQFLEMVEQSAGLFPERTAQTFSYFEAKLPSDDPSLSGQFTDSWKKAKLEAVLNKKAGFEKSNPSKVRVVLEPGLDILATADRLKLLLDQTDPERYRQLDYVDLRLPNRAYLCLINTPCTNPNP